MKLMKIYCCDECNDFRVSYSDGIKGICRLKNKFIKDDDTDFPIWCLLPNIDESDKKRRKT